MFKLFKSKQTKELYAPVTGKTIALENVSDPVFAQKMMGDGIAFSLESNVVCSPCEGTIQMVANTMHAVGIRADNGAEILIHIGLDTVNLQGKGFTQLVQAGEKVAKGTPLIEIDMDFMKEQGMILTTPMVITNSVDFDFVIEAGENRVIMGEDKVLTFK